MKRSKEELAHCALGVFEENDQNVVCDPSLWFLPHYVPTSTCCGVTEKTARPTMNLAHLSYPYHQTILMLQH